MSCPDEWVEDDRRERRRLERRPSSQTGFFDPACEDEFFEDEPEDEEYSNDE